jgi:hypothetical protein
MPLPESWYDFDWRNDQSWTHGSDGGCRTALRAIIATLAKAEQLRSVPASLRGWATWYLQHHCANCGACDDMEMLGIDGLCDRCRDRRLHT